MNWIDSHCHLEVFHRQGKLPAVLQRAQEAGVDKIITVGTKPGDWDLYAELAARHPHRIYRTAGLHPCEVTADWHDTVSQLAYCWTRDPLPVAVGEIGLDYFHLPKDPEAAARVQQWQSDAFRYQLDVALQLDAAIIVHSRNAFAPCLEQLTTSGTPMERVVFHCFDHGEDSIRRLNAAGGRASFTGIVTYKNRYAVRAALQQQSPDLTMVETDAPYLPPEPWRGSQCEPAMVAETGRRCAAELNIPEADFAALTTRNVETFFRLES